MTPHNEQTDMPASHARPSPRSLVEAMRARGDLRDARLEQAFLTIPRALFLPGLPPEVVYSDDAIAIKRAADGTVIASSSQPSMMALMLEQLNLKPGMNVLEIGTGTGYNAAIMQHLVGPTGLVTTIELDPQIGEAAMDNLARAGMAAVKVVIGDGAAGFAPRASYDRIIATAGIWDIPAAWVRQLKPRGILVAPLWLEGFQYSAAFELQSDGTLYSDTNYPCGFVRLRGAGMGEEGSFRVGSLLTVQANAATIDPAQLQMLLSQSLDAEIAYLPRASSLEVTWSLGPFVMLALPPGFTFAVFQIPDDQQAYGIRGSGFALIAPGSACFVPAQGDGEIYSFGSSDALIALQTIIPQWEAAGKPRSALLRIRAAAIDRASAGLPPTALGRRFSRRDHVFDVWLDGVRAVRA